MNFLKKELYKQALLITITTKNPTRTKDKKTQCISKHELHYYSNGEIGYKKCNAYKTAHCQWEDEPAGHLHQTYNDTKKMKL